MFESNGSTLRQSTSNRRARWSYFLSVGGVLYFLTLRSLSGCGGDEGIPPVGPSIAGEWSGEFYRTDRAVHYPLQAWISQSGDAVVIETNKGEGRACLLTGTIREDGHMRMIDAYDGEIWTTHWEPATEHHIRLADYVEAPSVTEPHPGLYVLELTR